MLAVGTSRRAVSLALVSLSEGFQALPLCFIYAEPPCSHFIPGLIAQEGARKKSRESKLEKEAISLEVSFKTSL
jgi:hypothetical protein